MRMLGKIAVAATALVAVGALITLVPVVPSPAAAATESGTARAQQDGGYCSEVEVTATLSARAVRPVLDLFGMTRVDQIVVSDVSLVGDPTCGEDAGAAAFTAVIANGACDQTAGSPGDMQTAVASLCDDTAIGMRLVSANGEVAEHGAYREFPLGKGWAEDGLWCAGVDTATEIHAGEQEPAVAATLVGDPMELCLDLR